MAVPKAMQEKYDAVAAVLIPYCEEYLDEEYKELCLYALEKLCRKRPSPLLSGRVNTWASGIVYAIGSNNFIFDRSMPVHRTAQEMSEPFGISKTTAAAKAAEIKKMLKISPDKAEWVLKSHVDSNPFLWMVTVNGLPFDARRLPLELQLEAYNKGLIPGVPALKDALKEGKNLHLVFTDPDDSEED